MRIGRSAFICFVCFVAASPLPAQNEARLKEAFEGRVIIVKLDMPATENGVDVYPLANPRIDFGAYARRLKSYGTALRSGQSIMVTKVKVKDKHIEFQLGAGGYGTFGDETSPSVPIQPTEKTTRERDLEVEIKKERDPARRRPMEQERDALRKEREREDARLRAAVAEAEERKRENIRQRALEAGSRFNIRYPNRVPPEALTPDGLRQALSEYVDFSLQLAATRFAECAGPQSDSPPVPALTLRKGLTLQETAALLGKPNKTSERREGTFTVLTQTFNRDSDAVTADYVEGVLVRYSISSR